MITATMKEIRKQNMSTVTSSCDIGHNNDSISKISSPIFCFLVDNPVSWI